MIGRLRKIAALAMVFTILTVSTASAQDTMQTTLRNSLYGGVIGALLGAAVMLLTENPDDHLNYIPTGAAVGVLVGAAYGVATTGVMSTAATEIDTDNREVKFSFPTVSTEEIFDEKTNQREAIERVDLVRVAF